MAAATPIKVVWDPQDISESGAVHKSFSLFKIAAG
jgi:hypothetical protein